MLITSNRAIYLTKGKKRNYVCRYSEFHITHATFFVQPTKNYTTP